jgi:hypothetical protein
MPLILHFMQMKTKAAIGVMSALALALIGAKPAITAVFSTPVHDVDNPARQPVQHESQFLLNPGAGSAGDTSNYIVPAGQRLVIETISAQAYVPSPQSVAVSLAATSGAVQVSPFVPLSAFQPWSGNINTAYGNAQVTAYADAGTTVSCFAQRLNADVNASGTQTINCTWSGHLVTLP